MLILNAMELCELLKSSQEPDGEGGYCEKWETDGTFMAAVIHQNTSEIRRAENQHLNKTFSVFTHKTVLLKHQAVFKRSSDGKIFRVTSDGIDRKTPDCASFSFARVTAEEWELK